MRGARQLVRIVCACTTLSATDVAAESPKESAKKVVPGQWTAYVAPAKKGETKVVVFVPDRKPEPGEWIPARTRDTPLLELRCAAPWQLRKPAKVTGRGAWSPNPSGDSRWVWFPNGARGAPPAFVAPAAPTDPADYGDDFFFCAKSADSEPWWKDADGKTVPGSWVTLVDGKRTTTIFVANTAAELGDGLPDIPKQERKIACPAKLHPSQPATLEVGVARPSAPYGRWVPDPFGSKRWAWVPNVAAPWALRPIASPEGAPEPLRRKCSWFKDAD